MRSPVFASALVLVLVLGLASACASAPTPPGATPPARAPVTSPGVSTSEPVDGARAKVLVHDGARLVDVRTREEFAEGHVDGAENLPVDTIGAANLGPKDSAIVVYCSAGKRSKRAAQTLRDRGYTRVFDLGAMSTWDE